MSQVIVRGGPESYHRLCEKCGRLPYTPVGKQYVLRDQLPPTATIFRGADEEFLVTAEIMRQLKVTFGRALRFWPIAVADKPADGLQQRMEVFLTPEQSSTYSPRPASLPSPFWESTKQK